MNQLTLFPADSLASHFPSPGNDAAKKMIVISGRKCLRLYELSNQPMCFAKMFLESSIWHSTRRLLIWEASGYTCETLVIPACALDAPHRRDRVWIIAYTDSKYIHPSEFENRVNQEKIDEAIKRWQSIHFIRRGATQVEFREADKSLLCREADGIPHELDRLKALGNAIVPYIAHLFFTIITAME